MSGHEAPRREAPWGKVSSVLTADKRVGNAAIRVYAALRSFADFDGGSCYTKEASIAERAGMTRQAVIPHLKKLQDLGYISTKARRSRAGRDKDDGGYLEYLFRDGVEEETVEGGGESAHLTVSPPDCQIFPRPMSENSTSNVRFSASPLDDQTNDQKLPHTARARERRLADFSPDFEQTARFIEDEVPVLGTWTAERHRLMLAKFRDHYLAKPADETPADLDAGFRKWLRDEPKFANAGQPARQREMLMPIGGGTSRGKAPIRPRRLADDGDDALTIDAMRNRNGEWRS